MSQLANWDAVQDRHTAVIEFVDWMQSRYGIRLDFDYAESGTPLDFNRLVDEFFGVDQRKLDQERRALLKKCTKP